jgi:hypothetical protein
MLKELPHDNNTRTAMSANKTKPTAISVHDFLAGIADARKRADALALIDLMQDASGARPVMWGPSIIGFGSYHYRYDSGREGDSPIIGFSPRKSTLVVYIVTGFSDAEEMLSKLGKHTTGKSCLYIKRLDDIDVEVLRALVEKSIATVRARYPGQASPPA